MILCLRSALILCLFFCSPFAHAFSWAPPLPINTNQTSGTIDADKPSVAGDGNGAFVAVWISQTTDTRDVMFSRSADWGATWSSPAVLSQPPLFESGVATDKVGVATDGNGNWVAVWIQGRNTGTFFRSQILVVVSARSSDNGVTWTPPEFALNDQSRDFHAPVMQTDGHGSWLICSLTELFSLNSNIGETISVARSLNNGASWSVFHEFDIDSQLQTGNPSLASAGEGNWVVAAHVFKSPGKHPQQIQAWRSIDNGTTWSGTLPIIQEADGSGFASTMPTVAGLPEGQFVVTWQRAGPDGVSIYASTSLDQGTTWSTPVKALNAGGSGENIAPLVLAVNSHSDWLMTWLSPHYPNNLSNSTKTFLWSLSTDLGHSWTAAQPVDPGIASHPNGSAANIGIAPFGDDGFLATYSTTNDLGGLKSTDLDIVYTTITLPFPPTADLELQKESLPAATFATLDVSYKLTVTNHGPFTATDVLMTDVVPASLSVTASTSTQGTIESIGNLVNANIDALLVDTSATVTITARANQAGDISNIAIVSGFTTDPLSANNQAIADTHILPASADLELTKESQSGTIVVGNDVTFNLTVVNHGPCAAENVVIIDLVPPTFLVRKAMTTQGNLQISGNSLSVILGTMPINASATITVIATSQQSGYLSNTANADSDTDDPDSSNNSDTANVTVQPATGADLAANSVTVRAGANRRFVTLDAKVEISNAGDAKSARSVTALYLADTPSLYTATTLQQIATKSAPALNPDFSNNSRIHVNLSPGTVLTGKFLIAVANFDHAVPDSRTDNNAASTGPLP